MNYTLITKTGRIMTFYIEGVANLYQSIYGGVVITQQVLAEGLPGVVESV